MLTNKEREQCELEQAKGLSAERAYNEFIKPFVEEKRQVLFEAFQTISISESEDLMEVKRMLATVNALELDIISKIETGRLATHALEKYKDTH